MLVYLIIALIKPEKF
nr:potassium-transporting ATPase subunit F [Streptomyces sp. RPA4-2]